MKEEEDEEGVEMKINRGGRRRRRRRGRDGIQMESGERMEGGRR